MPYVTVYGDEMRLGFVCQECGERAHMSPFDLVGCGTPVCVRCDEDMDFESAIVCADKVCTDVQR